MVTCHMTLPYPACAAQASLTTAWILVSASTSVCYEPGFPAGCVFPNATENPDLFPVYVGGLGRTASGLRQEYVAKNNSGPTRLPNTNQIVNGTVDRIDVTMADTKVTGTGPDPYVETLVVAAPRVHISSVRIGNLTFKTGSTFGAVRMLNVTLENSAHIGPSAAQHTVNLTGTVVDDLRGGGVAFFRPTGDIVCSGPFTRCFLLQKNEGGSPPATIFAQGGAQVVNVSTIVEGVFAPSYMIDFFAFDKEAETAAAAALAKSLIWPTAGILVSVFLAHGRPNKLKRPADPDSEKTQKEKEKSKEEPDSKDTWK